jgi:hypothetical protein
MYLSSRFGRQAKTGTHKHLMEQKGNLHRDCRAAAVFMGPGLALPRHPG